MSGIELVAGYAIGTVQVLLLDWWRRRNAHVGHLRLIRAELVRLALFGSKYPVDKHGHPATDVTPRAPRPTELFLRTIGETTFALTDEHRADNTQSALLGIIDGCDVLLNYEREIVRLKERVPGGTSEEKEDFVEHVPMFIREYNRQVDVVMYCVDDALRDIDRRLSITDFWSQLDRVTDGVPSARPEPAPVSPDDPRVIEWAKRRVPPAT